MSMKPLELFERIGTIITFQQRFDAKTQESMQKGGTADGVNQEIEYWANLADALTYTMVDKVSSKTMEKFLRDYTDMLGFKDGLADLAGDSLGDYLKEKWYAKKSEFEAYKEKMGTDSSDATPLENAARIVADIILDSMIPDSSLDRFLFLEGTDLSEKDSQNIISAIDNIPVPTDTTTIDNSKLDLNIHITDPLYKYSGGLLIGDSDWEAVMPDSVLNSDGWLNTEISRIASDNFRPGAKEDVDLTITNSIDYRLGNMYSSISALDYIQTPLYDTYLTNNLADIFQNTNNYTNSFKIENIDPLVIDMNGDGVKLVDFNKSNAVFDVDNDGKLENTGWVDGNDAIIVHDKNNDGIINNITETISEYYTDGVADGLEALKTLDSNDNNVFDVNDDMFSTLKVWQDKNENAITDEGELVSLSEAGVKSINLKKVNSDRERLNGNIVLSRSSVTFKDGRVNEAAAVDFATNPIGFDYNEAYDGVIVTNEDGSSSSFVIEKKDGQAVSTQELKVNSVFGNIGDDTITGGSGDDWLIGGAGSDTLSGGAGDDFLVIDSQDLQANIDGGEGNDLVRINDDTGVVFNLSKSNIEVVNGGNGNDILIGGGNSNVFISGGDGNDILIGGNADDVLIGENGNDIVDGGYGDDILRGHRGNDNLVGNSGNDYLDGGEGNDTLDGGVGDDILIAGSGNDTLNGGEGYNIAKYSDSYVNYDIKKMGDGKFEITNSVTGDKDTLTNINKIRFKDVDVHIDVDSFSPLPVKDTFRVDTSLNSKTIQLSELFANDKQIFQNGIHIKKITNVIGGEVIVNNDETITFIFNKEFKGTYSFDYSLMDDDGKYMEVTLKNSETKKTEIMRTSVKLYDENEPVDSLYGEQWYISDIGVKKVWNDYTGDGVSIGIFESQRDVTTGEEENAYINYKHYDLADSIDEDYKKTLAFAQIDKFSSHKTLVAGVIGAQRNGKGTVGIAYGATLTGEQWDKDSLSHMKNYDIVNNSWGDNQDFSTNFNTMDNTTYKKLYSIYEATLSGRNGLGTAVVFSAGNGREKGANTNYSNITNFSNVITVGSINYNADLGKLEMASKPFSTPGASILVSAPGSNITSTSVLLENSNGSFFGSDTDETQGTSFSAPIVSGVIALMLEANPNLGYRDIQEILALSATYIEDENTSWQINDSDSWNLGGMHVSHDYGYGNVDAHTAVRLAETWTESKTAHNIEEVWASSWNSKAILDKSETISTIQVNQSIDLENAQIDLNIDHGNLSDLIISIISPSGTESILFDRAKSENLSTNLEFSFFSKQFLGEDTQGEWKLKIVDTTGGSTGVLKSWDLSLSGSNEGDDDTYVFTNEYGKNDEGHNYLIDTKGINTINASSLISDSIININNGAKSKINNHDMYLLNDVEVYKSEQQTLADSKNREISSKNIEAKEFQTSLSDTKSLIDSKELEVKTNVTTMSSLLTDKVTNEEQIVKKLESYNAVKASLDAKVASYDSKYTEYSNQKAFFDQYADVISAPNSGGRYLILIPKDSSQQFLEILKDEYTKKVSNYNAISTEVNSLRSVVNSLNDSLNQIVNEYNSLLEINKSIIENYNSLISKNNSLTFEIKGLENTILEIDENISNIKTKIKVLENEVVNIEDNITNISVNDVATNIINNVYAGDGDDTIIGNELDNILYDGRGDDTLTGGAGADTFKIKSSDNNIETITDFNVNEDVIDISSFKLNNIYDLDNVEQIEKDVFITFDNNQKIILKNTDISELKIENFILKNSSTEITNDVPEDSGNIIDGTSGNDILKTNDKNEINTISGFEGNDTFILNNGGTNDIEGGSGSDTFKVMETYKNISNIIHDFDVNEDKIDFTKFANWGINSIKYFSDIDMVQDGNDTNIQTYNGLITLKNTNVEDLTIDNFVGIDDTENITINQTLETGAGWRNNNIVGGSGNDTLIVNGSGTNTLTGGSGLDTFVIEETAKNYSNYIKNIDVCITDFNVSTEKIDLSSFNNKQNNAIKFFSDLTISQVGNNTIIDLTSYNSGSKIVLKNVDSSKISSNNFIGIINIEDKIEDQYLQTSYNNYKLIGGKGNDTLVAKKDSFNNLEYILSGGSGKDIFKFIDNNRINVAKTIITDFNVNEDRFDFTGQTNIWGNTIEKFADLKIEQDGKNTVISHFGFTTILENVDAHELKESNFIGIDGYIGSVGTEVYKYNGIDGGYRNDNIVLKNDENHKIIRGGKGKDTFTITNTETYSLNEITDFDLSEDKIDLSKFPSYGEKEISDFTDLHIFQEGNYSVIMVNKAKIVLENIDVKDLNAKHFVGITDTSHSTENQVLQGRSKLVGGYGDDILIASPNSKDKILTGGAGHDTFKITEDKNASLNTIIDFNIDEDKIDLSLFIGTITGLSDLRIGQYKKDTIIIANNATLVLKNIDASSLTEEHFIGIVDTSTLTYNQILEGINISGGAGNDTLIAAHEVYSSGEIAGMYAEEGIYISANTSLTGGKGNDIFKLYDSNKTHTITDFNISEDKIEIDNFSGILAFSDLSISQSGDDTVIEASGTKIVLRNVNSTFIVADHFTGFIIDNTTNSNDNIEVGIIDTTDQVLEGNALLGGDGDDILIASSNENTLIGGAGEDIFKLTKLSGNAFTTIKDFNVNEDLLDVGYLGTFNQIFGYSNANGKGTGIWSNYGTILLENVEINTFSMNNFISDEIFIRDFIKGDNNNNIIVAENNNGYKIIEGGDGNDIFKITNVNSLSANVITDFDIAEDKIDLSLFNYSSSGIHVFSDLTIFQTGTDTAIQAGKASILLKNINMNDLAKDHFIGLDDVSKIDTSIQIEDQILYGKTLIGGYGDDILTASNNSNDKRLTGGEGSDIFKIIYDYSSKNVITDFNITEDKIDLSELKDSVTDLSQLNISQNGSNALIEADGTSIVLENIDFSKIRKDHFIGITDTKHSTEDQILYGKTLIGGYGDDILTASNTSDDTRLTGGEGSDIFKIIYDYSSKNVITDFNITEDKIDLSELKDSATDLSQLNISQNGSKALIEADGTSIVLENIDFSKIRKDHFIGITDTAHSTEDQIIKAKGTLLGGSGNDLIISADNGYSYNTLTGGEGSDIFKIGQLYSTTKDKITDFNINEDKIDFSFFNFYSNHQDVTSFSQLKITQNANNTEIVGGNATIILENINASTINENHFISLDRDSEKAYDEMTSLGSSNGTLLGRGNDTYIFNQGDGKDNIIDYQGNDTIVFGAGITKDDIVFIKEGSGMSSEYNINIQYGENDVIKLFSAGYDSYKIEQIELTSGEYLNQRDIDNIISSMSSYGVEMDIAIDSYAGIKNNVVLMDLVQSSWHPN